MPLNLKDTKGRDYIIQLFHEYLRREHTSDLVKLSKSSNHVSIVVHFNYLCEFASVFSELVLSRPDETLRLLDESLRVALNANRGQRNLEVSTHIVEQSEIELNRRFNTHVRFTALPAIPEVHKNTIPRSFDVGKFIALRGTVSRVGPVQVIEEQVVYECVKCANRISVTASFENYNAINPPRRCKNRRLSCLSTNLKKVSDGVFYAKNYQEIRVHERFRCLAVGLMPRSICVCLEDDLLDSVKPGDDVVINGIVTLRWYLPRDGTSCNVSLCIRANFIENLSEMVTGTSASRISYEQIMDFELYWSAHSTFTAALEARNALVRSICPDVYGMYWIKLSLALMLAGSPEWTTPSTNSEAVGGGELRPRIRGSPHILLVGDPGTAKSVLLRAAANLSHRAVLTTATGTTAAGLTATAVRDANGWSLDAGALVLADGGLCAIDEFTALHGTHRSAVHEAMEQQTISLAKAGLMTRLNCRCSVLAAANPAPESASTADANDFGLPTPLLSRFDLIWRLVDPVDSSEWDRKIATFVLKLSDSKLDKRNRRRASRIPLWSVERLREYFAWTRYQFTPQLTKPAADLLQRYYVWRRKHFDRDADMVAGGRCTLRLLESLVRLTKAHARLMAHTEASIEDAVIVIALVDISLESTSDSSGPSHGILPGRITPETIVASQLPSEPSADYAKMAKVIMDTLIKTPVSDISGQMRLDSQAAQPTETVEHNSTHLLSPDDFEKSKYVGKESDEKENIGNSGTYNSLISSSPAPLSSTPLFTSTQSASGRWVEFKSTMTQPDLSKRLSPTLDCNYQSVLEQRSVFTFKSIPQAQSSSSSNLARKSAAFDATTEKRIRPTDWSTAIRNKLTRFSSPSDPQQPSSNPVSFDPIRDEFTPLHNRLGREIEREQIDWTREDSEYRLIQHEPRSTSIPVPFSLNKLSFLTHPTLNSELTDEDFEIDL